MIILISKSVQKNKASLKELFNNTSDLILYEFETLSEDKALIGYLDGIIDEINLNENLLKPLICDLISPLDVKGTVNISETVEVMNMKDTIMPITNGDVVLFIEGLDIGYLFSLKEWLNRGVEQPTVETVSRGPKEAFVEDIIKNKTLIRRRIKNNNLVFEDYILGEQTNTAISLTYIKGIVDPGILEEARKRIKQIKTDSILDIGEVQDYIEDKPQSLICTVGNTERTDVAASKILEGRVGILCDGAPHILTVPKVFIENLQFPSDYYQRAKYSSFIRAIRYIAFFISFLLPGIYLALVLFHQEMLPTRLLVSIAGQREGAPLSAPLEGIGMVIFFEILKESSYRLPQTVGETVTLVGGLVIGQAAVEAGFVSAAMVIIIAATGMSEFVIPNLQEMIFIYRIVFILLGSIAGLYGIACGIIFLTIHFITLKSFGVPYMWPIAPYDGEGIKDFIIRYPLNRMNRRPRIITKKNAQQRNEENE